MAHQDDLYLGLLEECISNGTYKLDRTGVGSHSVFGRLIRYDLSEGQIPLLTTKKMQVKSLVHEMLWFISGKTNIGYLLANGVNIWNNWLIKGTEEYGAMSPPEIHAALVKHFKVDKLKIELGYPNEVNDEPFLYLADPDDAKTGVLRLNRKRFSRTTENFTPNAVHYNIAYKAVFGKDPQVLKDGDIGQGGYGAQWRAWEDTRLVPDRQLTRYLNMGYQKVVKIPATTTWGQRSGLNQTVVTRNIDQLARVIKTLSSDPADSPSDNWNSRRKIVTAWNPGKLEDAALPPCHLYFQFFNRPMTLQEMIKQGSKVKLEGYTQLLREHMVMLQDGQEVPPGMEFGDNAAYVFRPGFTEKLRQMRAAAGAPWQMLTTLLLMRSNDVPLGHPFNVAQYGLLTHMVAQCCNMVADELVWVGADTHIYSNQVDLGEEQLDRIPYRECKPRVVLNPNIKNIDDFKYTDITVEGYTQFWPSLPYPVAV